MKQARKSFIISVSPPPLLVWMNKTCLEMQPLGIRTGLTVQAGETEHPDLLGDVVPGSWSAQSQQLALQLIPHQQDPVCHGLHIALPEWGGGTNE